MCPVEEDAEGDTGSPLSMPGDRIATERIEGLGQINPLRSGYRILVRVALPSPGMDFGAAAERAFLQEHPFQEISHANHGFTFGLVAP